MTFDERDVQRRCRIWCHGWQLISIYCLAWIGLLVGLAVFGLIAGRPFPGLVPDGALPLVIFTAAFAVAPLAFVLLWKTLHKGTSFASTLSRCAAFMFSFQRHRANRVLLTIELRYAALFIGAMYAHLIIVSGWSASQALSLGSLSRMLIEKRSSDGEAMLKYALLSAGMFLPFFCLDACGRKVRKDLLQACERYCHKTYQLIPGIYCFSDSPVGLITLCALCAILVLQCTMASAILGIAVGPFVITAVAIKILIAASKNDILGHFKARIVQASTWQTRWSLTLVTIFMGLVVLDISNMKEESISRETWETVIGRQGTDEDKATGDMLTRYIRAYLSMSSSTLIYDIEVRRGTEMRRMYTGESQPIDPEFPLDKEIRFRQDLALLRLYVSSLCGVSFMFIALFTMCWSLWPGTPSRDIREALQLRSSVQPPPSIPEMLDPRKPSRAQACAFLLLVPILATLQLCCAVVTLITLAYCLVGAELVCSVPGTSAIVQPLTWVPSIAYAIGLPIASGKALLLIACLPFIGTILSVIVSFTRECTWLLSGHARRTNVFGAVSAEETRRLAKQVEKLKSVCLPSRTCIPIFTISNAWSIDASTSVGLMRKPIVEMTHGVLSLPDDELLALMAHEIGHVRNDLFAMRAYALLSTLFFFPMPLLTLLMSTNDREYAADDYVVRHTPWGRALIRAIKKASISQESMGQLGTLVSDAREDSWIRRNMLALMSQLGQGYGHGLLGHACPHPHARIRRIAQTLSKLSSATDSVQ